MTKTAHSVSCLYKHTLARLGLDDTPEMRVLFWDAHEALEWDEAKDWYIAPTIEEDCYHCSSAK